MNRIQVKPISHLELFVTECCNLKCDYCFASSMEGKMTDWDCATKSIRFAIESCTPDSTLRISFWGGEPFMQFNLIQKLISYTKDYSKKKNINTTFSIPTNGTLLNEENLEFIRDNNIQLSLSIDGTERSQSQRRLKNGESSFECIQQTIEKIKLYLKNHMPAIRKTVSSNTVNHFSEDILFFLNHGFSNIAFSPSLEIPWTETNLAIYEQEMKKIAIHWKNCLSTPDEFHISIWDEMLAVRELERKNLLSREGCFFCGAGGTLIAVDIYGDLFACHRFVFYDKEKRTHKLGSVFEGFSKYYEDFNHNSITNDILNSRTKNCSVCSYKSRCMLLCPAVNFASTSDIFKNDLSYCYFWQITESIIDSLDSFLNASSVGIKYLQEIMIKFRNRPYSGYQASLSNEKVLDVLTEKAFLHLNDIHSTHEKS